MNIPWDKLDETQQSTVLAVANEIQQGTNVVALTGKAGTGKSSCMIHLIRSLKEQGFQIQLMAPTNKAALVLMHKGLEAKTIHSALYAPNFDPVLNAAVTELINNVSANTELTKKTASETWNLVDGDEVAIRRAKKLIEDALLLSEDLDGDALLSALQINQWEYFIGWDRRTEPLENTIAIIDEASMMTQEQLNDIEAIYTAVVLVGDGFQLPPVKGECALDCAEKTHQLEKVFRSTGNITEFANSLRV